MRDADDLAGTAEDAVRKALAAGATEAEAFVHEARRTRVTCHGPLIQPTESHAIGIGVRVVVDQAIGVAASAGLHRIDTAVHDAVEAARGARERPGFALPDPQHSGRPPTGVPDAFFAPQPDALQHTVRTVMDALDDRRTEFKTIGLTIGRSRFAVANSRGLTAWDQGGRATFDLELRVANGGRPVTSWASRTSVAPLQLERDLLPCAQAAQERALGALEPRPLQAPIHTAVLAPEPTAQIVSRLLRTFNGALVGKGESPVSDLQGQPVASAALTVFDVPHGNDAPQRRRVDDEGVPTRPLTLVREGVFVDTFDDTLSGLGRTGSNGHGTRRGWGGAVNPGLLTPVMQRGRYTMDNLIEETDDGVLIQEPLTGMLTANIGTGEFSAVMPFAYRIEHGEVTHSLPNVTVNGNVLDIVKRIEAIGADTLETGSGHFAAMRAGGITCAT